MYVHTFAYLLSMCNNARANVRLGSRLNGQQLTDKWALEYTHSMLSKLFLCS